ncbi:MULTISPECIES: K+/H+ antiporter subunit F [Pseudoxanthomonas]|jgi:multicomponent K+:H+ antiporter subunit F|uniref:K+/H+ antiporter subunit F n=1 Tax=Pseudoxanthomonas winnipegensis TaxID=2480810 RepID=A0A4Q8LJZ0_9GAMM|nr:MULTISPECIES: K+/H+ antiporter subunit F [Pseudoxanthomonas]MDQ1117793.1 multicomponent K+:H+ antiporter subunit F [Pseudoxanthomonas winnipegensis]MDQ1134762.1 multicomponent K+:H+ antiporter subunit F [Pseudoxanthomonas winnipegensis]MDR6139005.1 multicomponent K+:H+ antiporter subunit F [Pseudoxanthomonas sp. SORGH_AS_0997]RZZ82581.1 K+/H+ antiporter subunit F [Pseudoxanthomonas winnipegensis]RZZ85146.1 K+/H+ antiporter subunit F [Pseudoxanthomonas winnipegensis]
MTAHLFFEHTIVACLVAIGVSALLCLWRLLRGPTVADRILALDTLSVTFIAALMLLGMHLDSPVYFEAALVVAMLGFSSTVVLCKFVLRRDVFE